MVLICNQYKYKYKSKHKYKYEKNTNRYTNTSTNKNTQIMEIFPRQTKGDNGGSRGLVSICNQTVLTGKQNTEESSVFCLPVTGQHLKTQSGENPKKARVTLHHCMQQQITLLCLFLCMSTNKNPNKNRLSWAINSQVPRLT